MCAASPPHPVGTVTKLLAVFLHAFGYQQPRVNLHVQTDLLCKYISTEGLLFLCSDCAGLILPGGLGLWHWFSDLSALRFVSILARIHLT